jgi:predicted unusual protein kinase regulating ubiquinone biosynthesis (AarF/ABC1/UbiB family)
MLTALVMLEGTSRMMSPRFSLIEVMRPYTADDLASSVACPPAAR